MFPRQLKASSRNSAAEEVAIAVTAEADAVVIDAIKSVTPNGRSGLSRSAACPRPSKAARK